MELGLVPTGQNYKIVPKLLRELKIDTTHFLGKAHLRGKKHNWNTLIPSEQLFARDTPYQSKDVKRRLIKEGLVKEICNKCGIDSWLGEKLSLHLDHINGISSDNRVENLRLLCPNCHSLTPTYSGRNKGKIHS